MSGEIVAAIIGALIGGLLAAGTGWFLDRSRETARLSRARELLTMAICDDLEHAINLYEKIREDWERTKIVWFSTLNELRGSRHTYENNKDWIHIFNDAMLRRKIFKYYLQSADCINNLEYQQKRTDELRNKIFDTVRQIKLNDNKMTDSDALALAVKYMDKEHQEFNGLEKSIPSLVAKLHQFKATAEGLLRDLK